MSKTESVGSPKLNTLVRRGVVRYAKALVAFLGPVGTAINVGEVATIEIAR
jgi:hypothetical protein